MWNLNDSPDQIMEDESEEGYHSPIDEKGKRVGSVSNSSSSMVLVVDNGNSEEEEGERGKKKRSTPSKIFGFSVSKDNLSSDSELPVVTRQFFPVENESEMGDESTIFPRAQWAEIKFYTSESPLGTGSVANPTEVSQQQPIKKSRRGPRSRSSQYRGVTFYRRTGRWESHIWFSIIFFPLIFTLSNFKLFGLSTLVTILMLDSQKYIIFKKNSTHIY